MASKPTAPEPNNLKHNAKRKNVNVNCRLFAQGHCTYGDTCKFLHVQGEVPRANRRTSSVVISGARSQHSVSSSSTQIAVPAKHDAELSSNRNTSLVPAPVRSQSISEPSTAHNVNPRVREVCRNFMSGHCKKGKDCRYRHDQEAWIQEQKRRIVQEAARKAERERREAARRTEQLAQKVEKAGKQASVTIKRIVLGSARVTVAAGLEIIDMISGFDSCCIKIENLPLDAKDYEIIDLFSQQGIDPGSIFLKAVKAVNEHLEAEILTKADIGQVIIFALDGLEFRTERLQCSVYENAAPDAMDTWNKADSKVLTISWRSPSVTMIADYDTEEQVQYAILHKNKKVYSGKTIKVERNMRPPGVAEQLYYVPTSVKVSGLPFGVAEAGVQQFMAAQSIRTLRSGIYSVLDTETRLRRALQELPRSGMQSFEVRSRDEDEFIKVEARFESWEYAKAALNFIEGRRLTLPLSALRLHVPDPFGYSSRIPLLQYNAQKKQWDSLVNDYGSANKSAHIYLRTRDRGPYAFICVRGEEKKAVGTLKLKVETLAKGKSLEAIYWHRSFLSAGGARFFREVHTKTGAFVLVDRRLRILKLFGEKAACEEATEALKNEVDRLASREYSVELKPRSVRFFVKEGLDILKEELGEESVALDISASPRCKVIITGGEEARHSLHRLIKESLNERNMISSSNTCPICYDEVTHPVELGCGHTFCTSCFRHYLGSSSAFPLQCMGDEDKCKIPIALPIIQRFLPAQQFDHLLEVAVESYVDKHPDKFKYCTTPDCVQIYTCQVQQNSSQCPTCFAVICTACHEEAHEGMTCAENRIRKDPNEQERLNEVWARENGVQKCPRCQVFIQKTEGCNHMTCKCGAHICWKCMSIFESDVIYHHLSTAHGGAFDVPLDLEQARNERGVGQVNGPVEPEVRQAQYVPRLRVQLGYQPMAREVPVQEAVQHRILREAVGREARNDDARPPQRPRPEPERRQLPGEREVAVQELQRRIAAARGALGQEARNDARPIQQPQPRFQAHVQRGEDERRQEARTHTVTETKRDDSWCVIS